MIRLTKRAATMIDSNLTNSQGEKESFQIGQRVRCKLEGDDAWVTGYVTGVDPIQVGGSIWDYVEPSPEQEVDTPHNIPNTEY